MKTMVGFAIVLLVYCYGAFQVLGRSGFKPKEGPYAVIPVSTSRCRNQPQERRLHPIVTFDAEIYNTSEKANLIRGNVTIHRPNRNMVVKVKNFIWEDKQWKLVRIFKNAGCKSPWLDNLMTMINTRMRFENCSIAKGLYSFENVDKNYMNLLWGNMKDYGRTLWRLECCSKQKILDDCWETIYEVQPIKNR